MSSARWIASLISLLIWSASCAADNSNYAVAVEYVRCLATTHDLQRNAKIEVAKAKDPTSTLMTGVRTSTKAKLEMTATIASLNQLKVADDASVFVHDLVDFLQQKIELYDLLIDIAAKLLGGPNPAVDYGKLVTGSAEISATIESIDEQIFKLANAFFAVMIDPRPDKQGHANRLKITRSQRAELLKLIDSRFGSSLDAKDKNWTVSGAWLMRANLKKSFKASDEPA